MTASELDLERAGQALHQAGHIAVISHVRPDGDAVGSMLGLGLALRAAGKTVQVVLQDGVPTSLKHLPGTSTVTRQVKGSPDLRVVVDCSDLLRTGMQWSVDAPPDINIDHHITNLNFGRINLVEPASVATSALVTEYLEEWGFEIDENTASVLLTGIISDTLGFRTSNINPKAMRLAAKLMEKGADLPELYNRALMRRSYEAARFWAVGLGRLQRQNRLIWTSLTLEERNRVNYPGNDDADLANFLATIDDQDIAIIFVEQKEGTVKVSWRAQPGWDVSKIALIFGGGGHPGAAGAMITGSLEQVQQQVLQATLPLLDGSPAPNGSDPILGQS